MCTLSKNHFLFKPSPIVIYFQLLLRNYATYLPTLLDITYYALIFFFKFLQLMKVKITFKK